MIKLIECPRDAMQGIQRFIPTALKAEYLNLLLQVGFDTLDFGSFVSHKAVPQLSDTAEVLSKLDLSRSKTKLLAIVANIRGAEEACRYSEISYLGFPLSVSETFQKRNTNSTIGQSLLTVEKIISLCENTGKEAVIYLSMGFGNPYGDPWNREIVERITNELHERRVRIVSLSDTTGVSNTEKIGYLFPHLVSSFPKIEFGLHLHSTPDLSDEKIVSAWENGCRRFDSALKGFGGCPMAEDHLTGNIATESLISFLNGKKEKLNLNMDKWNEAMAFSGLVFA